MLMILAVAGSTSAQFDPIGTVDVVYIDSVEAGPGQDVPITFGVRNDESLGSLSIPITYDPTLLTLKAISFVDSRAENINSKIISPRIIQDIDGHFVITIIRISEDPIPPGDGMMFTALFSVSDSATPGTVAIIDSMFYPPSGELLLVDSVASTLIRPDFIAGKITIGAPNQAPVFAGIEKQYVIEGDSLVLDIYVNDPDSDSLTIAATSKPVGAGFTNNGDGSGRLLWVPDFIGPNSADGSPFVFSFWGSDGDKSVETEVTVEVINRNRAPVISAPSEVEVSAGQQLELSVSAVDADFEPIQWSWSSTLDGAIFDDSNPAHFSWSSTLTDTGSFSIEFVATDPYGFSDTAQVSVTVNPVNIYVLRLDTVSALPGEEVGFQIYLDNMVPVSGFNVLFNYDPTALTILELTKAGTRAESFEYISITYNENGVTGNVRVIGIADAGSGTPPLEAGEGAAISMQLRVAGNLAFAGRTIPVRFRFLDGVMQNDNTLSDSLGVKIEQDDILHLDGYVRISEIGDINIGDINLNGLAVEIADVIYFTNYFINPVLYPFNALQFANSDVNQDDIVATVSDLVALINILLGKPVARVSITEDLSATVSTFRENARTVFTCRTDFEVGGAFVSIESDNELDPITIVSLSENMTMDYFQDGRETNIIIYSIHGGTVPAGVHDLFSIERSNQFSIKAIDLASADGRYVSVAFGANGASVPLEYALHQNYPNPFNPETIISLELPFGGRARLSVYNILGRKVITLLDEELASGTHSVLWDGADESGHAVASGVYLYRLETETVTLSRKMMLLK